MIRCSCRPFRAVAAIPILAARDGAPADPSEIWQVWNLDPLLSPD